MPPRILKRALLLLLALLGAYAAAICVLFLYIAYVVAPCPPTGKCYYQLHHTGDWISSSASLAVAFLLCLPVSWLSFRIRKPSGRA
ncbi:hypothetical protein K4L06_14615 [Lysobacter sp. BMK333-48F3]|uniref:hypothetical protein n=1 Tax=Lysobacter sp. BMK333-48F3 TaxID=2867962 RepID=UPI001C8B80A5|nr:hypothetical protein [Lysobacter sp. BMK333-48F3]MBX9402540.1 hypothetical protein [Lysobacter sp. BMK333-48F3]